MSAWRPPSRSHSFSRPGTALSRSGGRSSDEGESLVALLQSRQGGEVGAVAFHMDYRKLVLTQYGDSPTFVKTLTWLHTNPPYAVLVPPAARPADLDHPTLAGGDPSLASTLLVRCIQDAFPRTAIVPVARKWWDEQASLVLSDPAARRIERAELTLLEPCLQTGYEFLAQLSAKDFERANTVETAKSKYYALSAVCALVSYLATEGTTFAPHSLKVSYAAFEGHCLIDSDSAKNLELVQNVLNHNSRQHLLGMLNRCFTPSGTRLLRANILAPSTDSDLILRRYEAVDELVNTEERLRSLRKALESLKHIDLERLTSKILASTSHTKVLVQPSSRSSGLPKTGPDPSMLISQKLNHLLNLRTFLLSLSALRTSLERVRSPLLAQSLEVLEDERLGEMRQIVEDNVNKDLWLTQETLGKRGRGGTRDGPDQVKRLTKASRLFAIRSEKKRFLDVARETYRENISDINELRDSLRTKFGLDISLVNTDKGEFLLECSKEDWNEKDREVHSHFININEKGKTVKFASLELQKRNARISESILEVLLLSDEILDEIFDEIRGNVGCLYRCAEAVALLDMLASFSDVSYQHDYVRPELTDTLAIKAGRNPLHERFRMSDGAFVPNDTYANESSSFQIITGSNMSGKSTLLRQIALLHVMAQIGCFVPATYASFRPVSALLTRLSNDDNIEASLSTFAQEMTTMSVILGALALSDSAQPCLVIVDELGRGTSPEEGVGIAHAIAEEIIRSKASCFFATHFKELSTTLSRFPNVVSLHLETEIDRSQPDYSLTFHHRLLDGTTPLTHYGLELAKIAKLPNSVIDKAHLVAGTLDALSETQRLNASALSLHGRRRGLLALKATLRELANSTNIDGTILLRLVRDLQQQTRTMLEQTTNAATCSIEEADEHDSTPSPLKDESDDTARAQMNGSWAEYDALESEQGEVEIPESEGESATWIRDSSEDQEMLELD
ncbi:MutS family protein MSH4 [Sporobolomyces koalae]|uniref:MutS family protein MSH4 n=1 Tax=Sporobolomyces koalae TaxID=500713 RepID=UPI00317F8100